MHASAVPDVGLSAGCVSLAAGLCGDRATLGIMALDPGGSTGTAVDEPLRPPESWPGAGGLKSVAPEVPSWPTGPIRLHGDASGAPSRKKRRRVHPGEGWPGMEAPGSPPATAATPTTATDGSRGHRATSASRQGGATRSMGGAVVLLLACLLLTAWVVADPASRAWQLAVLAIVLVAGGVVAAITLRRRR